jgi:uncharacterized membrane protein
VIVAVSKQLREGPTPTGVVVVMPRVIVGVIPVIVGVIMMMMWMLRCHEKMLPQRLPNLTIAP